ncbi:MAG: hypothetical protein ABW252_05780 [Polyangiales bacterium]
MSLAADERGAAMVEYLIAFLPVMMLFASIWQVADAYAAHLIVQRAASAAGRAASVVLPDDPFFYGGAPVDVYEGVRRAQIERAAHLVLVASSKIAAAPEVRIEGTFSGNGPITATVDARYRCYPGWGVLVCGVDGLLPLTASARYPYHGARYGYP